MPGVAKKCIACAKDVSAEKRVKDQQGRYYCEPCWQSRTSNVQTSHEKSPSQASRSFFVEGDLLAVSQGAVFPRRCIYCNAPGVEPPQKMGFGGKANAAMIGGHAGGLAGALIGAAIDAARKEDNTGPVLFGAYLCEVHKSIQKILMLRLFMLLGAAVVLGVIVGVLTEGGYGALTAFFVLILAIIYIPTAQKRGGKLKLKRSESGFVYLAGACKPFLESLQSNRDSK